MATTNLNSQSLGDILMESGNGSPNHVSPFGSIYLDRDSALLYRNINGGSSWDNYNKTPNGSMYLNGNATPTTITTSNQWYSLRGLSWSGTSSNGVTFSAGTNTLVINSLSGGKYLISGGGTFSYVTTNTKYELGISKNFSPPIDGYYQGCSTDTSVETEAYVNIFGYVELNPNETVELGLRNTTGTNNALLTDANLIVYKIGNL